VTPPFSWRKYLRYVATGLCFMYAFKLLDKGLESTPVVKRLERANLDALFSGKVPDPSATRDIFLITVTDEDYRQIFGAVSPLQPAKLNEIISAILDSHPRVLGVDFDTSDWKDADIPAHDGTTIVWARELLSAAGKTELGGIPSGASKSDCYGVPSYVPDDDSVIREYSEWAVGSDQVYPTVAVNLAAAFQKLPCIHEKSLKDWKKPDHFPLINYAGDARTFNRLSAGALLQLKGTGANPLKDKLVLLGGSYHAARDAYPTPVGYLDGVVILAQTALTRLPGHELRSERPEGLLHSWISIQSYVLLLATFFFPKGWRLAITIVTGPVDAFLGNWIWFYTGGTFLSFMPYLVGLTAHQIYDHIKDYRKLIKDNREMRDQLRAHGLTTPKTDD
jgi:CHASE2 domain-containing sensor protein